MIDLPLEPTGTMADTFCRCSSLMKLALVLGEITGESTASREECFRLVEEVAGPIRGNRETMPLGEFEQVRLIRNTARAILDILPEETE